MKLTDSIYGSRFALEAGTGSLNDYYSIQTNNSLNRIVRKARGNHRWLEWCGVEAVTNCVGAIKGWQWIVSRCTVGEYTFQLGDLIGIYLHEPSNYPDFIEDLFADYNKVWTNRYIIHYVKAIQELVGLHTVISDTYFLWELKVHVMKGGTILYCMVEPGHYRSLKAYNIEKKVFIGDDSFPDRLPGRKGSSIEITHDELKNNSHRQKIFISPPREDMKIV